MRHIRKAVLSVIVWAMAVLFLSPLYIMIVNSFKNRAQMTLHVLALPPSLDFQYYSQAMAKMNILTAYGNSLLMTVTSILFLVVFTSMTAWMLVRTRNRISSFIFFVFVATMIIPFQAIMMPLMQVMGFVTNSWHIPMLNTRGGLMFMYVGFGASMGVFLYHGFIKSVPVSLEEAATLDGCSTFGLFWRIVFPLLKSITVTVIILDIIWIWNDFLLPSLALSSIGLYTIPLSTFKFFGQFTIQWNLAMAGLILTILPVIVFYLFAQKYIVKGVAAGAIK